MEIINVLVWHVKNVFLLLITRYDIEIIIIQQYDFNVSVHTVCIARQTSNRIFQMSPFFLCFFYPPAGVSSNSRWIEINYLVHLFVWETLPH